jgi:hypothetical protein
VQRVQRVQMINNLKKKKKRRRSWFEVQRRRDVRASRKNKPIVRQCFWRLRMEA